jgi:hypothetical protein
MVGFEVILETGLTGYYRETSIFQGFWLKQMVVVSFTMMRKHRREQVSGKGK